jgi:hypothetical protein
LKSLTIGAAVGSVLRVIPAARRGICAPPHRRRKIRRPNRVHPRNTSDAHQYKTLQALCETILPADADSAGAIEAGAPEFIDLLTSENTDYQTTLGDGLKWLDSTCTTRYGKAWLDSTPQQQAEILDLIAYRKNALQDKTLEDPVEFFSFLRNFTADGFFTSKIGITYLGYKGNTFLTEFPGCPPVPGV